MIDKELATLTQAERDQYNELCAEFPVDQVETLFSVLGPSELFDGIVTMLEDHNY